ncbi:thermostable hemolysin [Rhodanobacter terrae]|uniref:Thermostable hemolysin n=1 Tax=Rhodanobacter terrae TaxID=418647 RepID=A0ABW0SYX6_9GAMM
MHFTAERSGHDPCILESVQPLLSELDASVHADVVDADHAERTEAQSFVHRVFAQRYRADVQSFYPTLLSFRDPGRPRAVVGLRGARAGRLFAEQYLEEQAQDVIGERLGSAITREELVEVGSLALENPGDARWVIAACTCFLHALGYRWVLFTATRTLVNTFQRLGLQPLALVSARPLLLDDKGEHWGSYYQAGPVVCAGNVASGYQKLHRHVGHGQPMLRSLLDEMERQAELFDSPASARCGTE